MGDKTLKSHIVSFRIPKDEAYIVSKMLEGQPITGVKSVNQFFRKIARDYLAGRVSYKRPEDMLADSDLVASG
jgi:hypothetical protein